MKNIIFMAFVVFSATHCLMAMESDGAKKGYLAFSCNKDKQITAWSKFKMPFAVKPEVFNGKKITEVISLDTTDKEAIERGFIKAIEDKEQQEVYYRFDQKLFVAKITALKKLDKTHEFFVKVKEKPASDFSNLW